jgi:16S rRNA (cytosine967-C5)-methyltransferase
MGRRWRRWTARPVGLRRNVPVAPQPDAPGLAARRAAAQVLDGVLRRSRPLDDQLEEVLRGASLEDRDRALVRRLVATVLRRLGTLHHLLGMFLNTGFPNEAPRVEAALLLGAAQILWLEVPDHAAVDLSVRLVQENRKAARYAGLVNAVLRRVSREGVGLIGGMDTVELDTPEWLLARWTAAYGVDTARAVALANGQEPPLDLTVKAEPEAWAERLAGRVLPTGSVRIVPHGAISQLPGYADGEWWVQDAAAALPARLLGEVKGLRVADICAAPGGKTAQLAYAGARVTAVDRSARRLERLQENLTRLGLTAETVVADATEWEAEPFDAVLVDAPCSSTGTIRRHPDVPWLKKPGDLQKLISLQRRLLDRATALVKPGGTIVYCTCSLEPEEGVERVEALLAREPGLRRHAILPEEVGGLPELLTAAGDLRSLPCHMPDADPRMNGLDGFYAARLRRV